MAVRRSSGRSSRSGRRRRRVVKVLGIVALAFVALVLVAASVNLILTRQEKSRFVPYGQRVSVDGGSMNVWRNGHPVRRWCCSAGWARPHPRSTSPP